MRISIVIAQSFSVRFRSDVLMFGVNDAIHCLFIKVDFSILLLSGGNRVLPLFGGHDRGLCLECSQTVMDFLEFCAKLLL